MRTTLAVLILALAASVADAQSFLIGGRFGRTSASQRFAEASYGYEQIHGLTAGFTGTFQLTPWLGVQAEMLYVEKGTRRDQSFELRLDYLEAPIMVRVASPVTLRGFRPFLASGMAPSVELRCSGYTEGGYVVWRAALPPNTHPLECQNWRKRTTDRSQVFTGGVLFERGANEFSVELRRTHGSDIGYSWGPRRNDVAALVVGVSRRVH